MEEFDSILKEATQQVEDILKLEDKGWVNLSAGQEVIPRQERVNAVKEARVYALKDPLGSRSVSLMTDYSFGTGVSWSMEDDRANDILKAFWDDPSNQAVFSSKGQRKSSNKLLIDGEIFFAVFLGNGGKATVRRIDPLEITEFITDPDDIEDVRYYRRDWTDTQHSSHTDYYRSFANPKDKSAKDSAGKSVSKTQDAFVYHIALNDLYQRGNSYLLPALDWIKLYRRFLASRVAVMLALAKFAWKLKVQGGQQAVDSAKSKYNEEEIAAGSTHIENLGAEMTPIRTDSGASQAYQDGRMLKLQISAATGWPEQYFGDISIGNLATAKTVEYPVEKMVESYQSIWSDAYNDLFQLVLEKAGIPEGKRYVDIDMPSVSREEIGRAVEAISGVIETFPSLASSEDLMQQALLAVGMKDVNEVLDRVQKESKGDIRLNLARELREFRKVVQRDEMS